MIFPESAAGVDADGGEVVSDGSEIIELEAVVVSVGIIGGFIGSESVDNGAGLLCMAWKSRRASVGLMPDVGRRRDSS